MAQAVRGAVQAGEYASSGEIIREALRDWRHKRALQEQELGELRAQVQNGLTDNAAGRVRDFDAARIIRLAAGLRAYFHRDSVLYYRFTDTEVIIVRVVHGARDVRALTFDEGTQ